MKKRIAFICVHNSCRSQIAEALGRYFASDVFESHSAGIETKPEINQDVGRIMKEIYGIDMEEKQYSKLLADISEPDIAISMGCNVYREVIMYLIFGGLTTLVSLSTYFFCTMFILDAEDMIQLQIANIVSWMTSVTFAYLTNKRYVFQSHNAIGREVGTFYLSRLSTLLMDMTLMYLFVTIFAFNDAVVKVVVQFVVIVVNYLLSKFLVFKEEKTDKNI